MNGTPKVFRSLFLCVPYASDPTLTYAHYKRERFFVNKWERKCVSGRSLKYLLRPGQNNLDARAGTNDEVLFSIRCLNTLLDTLRLKRRKASS
jgi:hypothetical protein